MSTVGTPCTTSLTSRLVFQIPLHFARTGALVVRACGSMENRHEAPTGLSGQVPDAQTLETTMDVSQPESTRAFGRDLADRVGELDLLFIFSSRRRHTMWNCDWSSDVCSSDLAPTSSYFVVVPLRNLTPNFEPLRRSPPLRATRRDRLPAEGKRPGEGEQECRCLPGTRNQEPRSEERRVGKECRLLW